MPFSSTYCPFFAWYFFAFHSFFLYSLFHRLCSSAHSCDCDKCGDNRFCSWLGATASFFCSGCYTINLALCMRAEWLFRIFEQRICLSGGLFFASPSFSLFFVCSRSLAGLAILKPVRFPRNVCYQPYVNSRNRVFSFSRLHRCGGLLARVCPSVFQPAYSHRFSVDSIQNQTYT